MNFYANLHFHSAFSDGVYSPEEIVDIAKKEGYKALALSDHDTIQGFKRFKTACQKNNIEYIAAVEFSVIDPKEYHIVAFDFDMDYMPMKKYLEEMSYKATLNTKSCFDEAVENGEITGITWQEILDYNKDLTYICNNHVYNAIIDKGLGKKEDYIDWFNKNFLHQRSKYQTNINFLSLDSLINLIKNAGGIPVIAHPHNQLDEIDYLIKCGIQGMEVWHPILTDEEKQKAYQIAIKKNLYISGGSDHHGLCGGLYSSCPKDMPITEYSYYIEPLSVGTTEMHFKEIKERKLYR